MQVEQAVAAQERLREGLEKAEAEVAASRDHGSAASERAAQAEAELAREKEKVRAELESRLAEAERGVRAAGAAEVADLDARVQGLRDELKAEQERGAKLLEAQQQMAGALASGEGLRNELVQKQVELETLRVQGDSTLDRATRAEAELEQERQRAAAETKRAREAADAKAFLEGKLAQVESDRVSKESSLRAAERKLQEQEQMLGHTQELKRRLGDLEPKLAALEQRREGASSTAQEDARVADLEQRLAEAAELQSQLQRRLASAEQELNSTKAMSEDFKAFAAQAEAALAEERKKQEKTEQEIMESSTRRDEAITANSKLEAKLLELERKFKAQERHVLPVEAPEMQAAARADVAAGAASMQQPLEQVNLVEKKLKAKPGDVAPVLCSFKVESLDHQQLMEDRNLKAAFEASVKQTLASEAGGLVSKSQIQLVLTAGSVVVEASIEHAPGVDLGAVAQRLGSSLTLARKVAAYIGALDGIHRISSGPIKVTNISVTHGSDPKVSDPDAGMADSFYKDTMGDSFYKEGGKALTDRSQAQWEPLASKFFNRLDRLGTGGVENFQVLQLWPLLSRQMDCSNAALLAAQLLQSTSPMNGLEWMALMKALHSIVGPRRLRRNLRSAEAYYGELRAGGALGTAGSPTPRGPACSLGSPAGPPVEAKQLPWPGA